MRSIARTPEELEMLFEDALVVRDRDALCDLFESGAVLVRSNASPAFDSVDIASLAFAMWADGNSYIADPLRIVQSSDVALIVVENGINVATRGHDGVWRYVIVFVSVAN